MESSAGGNDNDRLGAVFTALADPTRRSIVERLRGTDATVTELARDLDVRTPSMSKHLTVLQAAGLITRHPDAQRRHCRLAPEAFVDLAAWMARHEDLWGGRLDRLDALLEEDAQRKEGSA